MGPSTRGAGPGADALQARLDMVRLGCEPMLRDLPEPFLAEEASAIPMRLWIDGRVVWFGGSTGGEGGGLGDRAKAAWLGYEVGFKADRDAMSSDEVCWYPFDRRGDVCFAGDG